MDLNSDEFESAAVNRESPVYASDDKRKLRNLKKAVKRRGNKHRRSALKRQLRVDPREAHFAEESFGRNESKHMNLLDRPADGRD